jgi:CRP-like cAMP-binding protein
MKHRASSTTNLAGIPPFDHCDERALAPLLPHADRLRVPRGTTLARAGQLVHQFVVVLDGEVASRAGDEVVVVGPGAQLGGDELLRGDVHHRTLTTVSDVELLVVFGPAYRWAVQALPECHTAA